MYVNAMMLLAAVRARLRRYWYDLAEEFPRDLVHLSFAIIGK